MGPEVYTSAFLILHLCVHQFTDVKNPQLLYLIHVRWQQFAIPPIIPLLHEIAGTPFPIWGKEEPVKSQFVQQSESEIHFSRFGKTSVICSNVLQIPVVSFLSIPNLRLMDFSLSRETLSNHMVRASRKTLFQLDCPVWLWMPWPRLETEVAAPWETRD